MSRAGNAPDLTALAALHAAAFTTPRPWSAEEFSEVLGMRGTLLLRAPQGLAVVRVIADEAELLTIAVAPEARRRGLGRHLLRRALAAAQSRGARRMFLEVAEDNEAARALYAGAGFAPCGRRRGYFHPQGPGGGPPVDALLLACTLEGGTPGE